MSCYIHCHIGQEPPPYLLDSIESIKRVEPESRIFLVTDQMVKLKNVDVLQVETIISEQTKRAMEMSLFSGDPNPLWRTSIFRIFLVRDALKHNKESFCFHFDSDVLLFESSEQFHNFISDFDGLYITPCNSKTLVFGFSRFGNSEKINEICSIMSDVLLNDALRQEYFVDMPNEMELLFGIYKKRCDLIKPLNIFPNETRIVFDPSSYGQYFAGTHQGHPPGFAHHTHDIGAKIINKIIKPVLINKKPFVEYQGILFPIMNLHVHSKNTRQFLE
jgi:hypothetical protein